MNNASKSAIIYGLMAEFDSPEQLVAAAQKAYQQGYRRMDAYSPFPVEGLAEAIGSQPSRLPLLVVLGGLFGGLLGYGMLYYAEVIDYPLNIGGKPFHSWPAFIPITFETSIFFAALTAVLGMLALNGLPMPYHPVFNVPRFALASRDRFFLCLEARDPRFDPEKTKKFLESLGSQGVTDVEQ